MLSTPVNVQLQEIRYLFDQKTIKLIKMASQCDIFHTLPLTNAYLFSVSFSRWAPLVRPPLPLLSVQEVDEEQEVVAFWTPFGDHVVQPQEEV